MTKCKIAVRKDIFERYTCPITGSDCMYIVPDSKRCAKEFGEGPDATKYDDEMEGD